MHVAPTSPATTQPTSERRQIARIAVPVSLEMIFALLLGFIDQIIVGRLGALAIASVGFANSVTFIGVLALSALGSGAAILTARLHGASDKDGISRVTSATLVVGVLVAAVLAAPLLILAPTFLQLVGAPREVAEAGTPYFQIVVGALPLVVIGGVASAVLRSLGHARTPMIVTMIGVLVNTVLGYALVFGFGPIPALGLAGAAWATLAAQLLKAVVLLWQLYGPRALVDWRLPERLAAWQATTKDLFHFTLPLAFTEVAWSVGTFLYAFLFGRLSVNALAASQIVNTLEGIFIVGSFGLGAATTALVGQAVGSRDAPLAARRVKLLLNTGVVTGVAFGLLFAGSALTLGLFYPKVPGEVLTFAVWGILINAAFQWVKVQNMIRGMGVLPSGGDTRGVIVGDVVGAFLVGLPLAYLLAFPLGLGVVGLFWARVLEEAVKLAVFAVRTRRISWRNVVEGQTV